MSSDDLRSGDVLDVVGDRIEIDHVGEDKIYTTSGETLDAERLHDRLDDGRAEIVERGTMDVDTQVLEELGKELDDIEEMLSTLRGLDAGLDRSEISDLVYTRTSANKSDVRDGLDVIENLGNDPRLALVDLIHARTGLTKSEVGDVLNEIDDLRERYGEEDA